ncbi:MAG: DNA mismatch repair protein MutS [Bryobacteraceae bacterium]|nr:DNA mismatch repair protein MutS [Solibacteraceae bacterium]MCO5352250.1 DNA mismatch repair protein MutS [Bryobacteraceae bacterium]
MRQHAAAKQQAPNALLFFRLGDFYELFFEDAIVAARELEITLTSRNKDKGEPVPMCGVPAHSAEGYIARLIQKGYRVAICDQVEDPKLTKKLVKREITRIVSPGTVTESALLRSHENNYLAALYWKGAAAGLAYVDVSTGEFRATELERVEAAAALEQLNTRELLVAADAMEEAPEGGWTRTPVEPWTFSYDHGERALREHFKLLTLDGCGLGERRLATAAAGALLSYLRETQKSALDHMDRPAWYDRTGAMLLDAVTVRNLELVEPLFSADLDGQRDATLIRVLDRTMTGMGGRLLRRQVLRPSLDRAEIEARLDAVEYFVLRTIERSRLRDALDRMLDLERLLAKVTIGTANPRDVLGLGRSLGVIPALAPLLAGPRPARLDEVVAGLDEVAEVRDQILAAITEEPPVTLNDGGVIRAGYHAELDELRNLSRNARSIIAAIETRERERTGIASLKVRFNNVFGFYIEISKSNLRNAPADYERKQTLVNAERFTTPELKELETKVLDADDKALAIEREIFAAVREAAAGEAARIRATAAAVAALDVYSALADAAAEGRWVRPRFSDNGEWKIVAGRHPVIERLTEREAQRFIPNDLYLDRESCRIAVITGPNMGGKSTYLRQAALISVMAQTGCYVPAEEARVPIVDRVFTRIGASDNLARGRSTFMVEMTETAVILNTATERSLIVLDEIGRGTATYDGLALAWSVIEHLHERTGAYTLFATHYHELTELAGRLEGVRNLHVSVKESGDQVIFLRKVEPGAADRSYGIEVARLAGLPLAVIERAREILALHEKTEHTVSDELRPPPRKPTQQITLFEPVGWEIADRIRAIDVDNLRPVEALQILNELKEELKRQ